MNALVITEELAIGRWFESSIVYQPPSEIAIRNPVLARILARSTRAPKRTIGGPRDPGCLLWTGEKNRQGYGRITAEKRKHYVHRAVWAACFGAIPPGLCGGLVDD